MSQKWEIRGSYIYSMVCFKVLAIYLGNTNTKYKKGDIIVEWIGGRDQYYRGSVDQQWKFIQSDPTFNVKCYLGKRKDYIGTISQTKTGSICKVWDSSKWKDSDFPDESVADAKNYCRLPDNSRAHWCYTTDGWGYCDVPKCELDHPCDSKPCDVNAYCEPYGFDYACFCNNKYNNMGYNKKISYHGDGKTCKVIRDCYSSEGDMYVGYANETAKGVPCIPWHKKVATYDPTVDQWNWCRVPSYWDGKFNHNGVPSCYTEKGTKPEKCAVPKCT